MLFADIPKYLHIIPIKVPGIFYCMGGGAAILSRYADFAIFSKT